MVTEGEKLKEITNTDERKVFAQGLIIDVLEPLSRHYKCHTSYTRTGENEFTPKSA